jgi:CHU_C Type IX secretion signal domain
MKNTHFLLFLLCSFVVVTSDCSQEPPVAPQSKIYESCCGSEAVEKTFGDAYIFVPNVFTPNGDGINDYFVPSRNENVDYFDAYLIYTDVGDTLLFDRVGFDFSNIPTMAWDGNREDGTPYIGAFKYEFVVFKKDGTLFTVKGSACRIECGSDASVFKGRSGCFYPAQVNADGYLDSAIPNKESDCFK